MKVKKHRSHNPPRLIVIDMRQVCIHTSWANAVTVAHDIVLADLRDPERRQILKWAFADSERLSHELRALKVLHVPPGRQ